MKKYIFILLILLLATPVFGAQTMVVDCDTAGNPTPIIEQADCASPLVGVNQICRDTDDSKIYKLDYAGTGIEEVGSGSGGVVEQADCSSPLVATDAICRDTDDNKKYVRDAAGTGIVEVVTGESGTAATATALADGDKGDVTVSSGTITIDDSAVQYDDIDFLVDEDNMSSDSAVKVPTQQSVKYYIDSAISEAGLNIGFLNIKTDCYASGDTATTTTTCTSGSNSFTLDSATGWSENMGIAIAGCGAASAELICPFITISGAVVETWNDLTHTSACNAGTTQGSPQTVTHDDTQAFNTCKGSGNVGISLPSGTFYITSPIEFSDYRVVIKGAGRDLTKIYSRVATNDMFRMYGDYQQIYDVTLGGAVTQTGGSAIVIGDGSTNAGYGVYENIFFGQVYTAVTTKSAASCRFFNMQGYVKKYGFILDNKTGVGGNQWEQIMLYGQNIAGSIGIWGKHFDSEMLSNVTFNAFEDNVYIDGSTGMAIDMQVSNSFFGEQTLDGGSSVTIFKSAANTVQAINFTNCQIFASGTNSKALYIGVNVAGITVSSSIVSNQSTGSLDCVTIDGQQINFLGNWIFSCGGDGISVDSNATYINLNNNIIKDVGAYGITVNAGVTNLKVTSTQVLYASSGEINYTPGSTIQVFGVGSTRDNMPNHPGSWGYIVLTHPHRVDGTGAIIVADPTLSYYGQAKFSNSADYTANFVEYRLTVPYDLDTSTDLILKSFKFRLGGADTGKHSYDIRMANVADSASYTPSSFVNSVAVAFNGDASGASGDVETVTSKTLTNWKGSLTAGNLWVIKVGRDGDDAIQDTSTVDSYSGPIVIRYRKVTE